MSQKIKWIEAQQRHAFCALSAIPVRTEAKDSSEQCTQLLFGEPIEILQYNQPWLKIRSLLDGYEGFIDHKQVLPLTDKELRRWLDQYRYATSPTLFIQGPMGQQLLSGGALVGPQAEFQIGSFSYQIENELGATDSWTYALSFLNTPYLWGGKSHFGIDCSGLVQNVFRQLQINLPRDAYQQATHGQITTFEDCQILDLAFFKNMEGRIHHVGILGPEHQILHASGQVRIDTLTQEGIYNASAAKITHSLYQIKRLF